MEKDYPSRNSVNEYFNHYIFIVVYLLLYFYISARMPVAVREDDIKTAPFDPRFPNTNQTRYCYQSYLDYYRCQKVRGADYKPCEYFSKVFHSVCPNSWIEKWDDQREEGTFPGNI